jgi:2Fe-2S ferredoxin
MATLELTTRGGTRRTITAREGLSVMEAIRAAGVAELEAVCGGSCSCATCHVYIDERFAASLPPMGLFEIDLLDTSEHRTSRSRLACQVRLTAALDGLAVQIAPED